MGFASRSRADTAKVRLAAHVCWEILAALRIEMREIIVANMLPIGGVDPLPTWMVKSEVEQAT